jgi:hypothetical protein
LLEEEHDLLELHALEVVVTHGAAEEQVWGQQLVRGEKLVQAWAWGQRVNEASWSVRVRSKV